MMMTLAEVMAEYLLELEALVASHESQDAA